MRHALWVTFWVAAIAVFLGLAFLAMFGLTRAAHRAGQRRGWREGRLVALTVLAALSAFMGGWVIYLVWWPFARLARPYPRWHIAGPVIGTVLVALAGGALLNIVNPTAHPTWINDAGGSVTINGCTDDPASFSPGERSSGPFVSTTAVSCDVYFDDPAISEGCLYLPRPLSDQTVIRISGYKPGRRSCP